MAKFFRFKTEKTLEILKQNFLQFSFKNFENSSIYF